MTRISKYPIALLLLGVIVVAGCASPTPEQAEQTPQTTAVDWRAETPAGWKFYDASEAARAPGGMVATDARIATDVGVAVLEAGGNAIDAAVATGFALAVVYPVAGNIGGGGFAVVRLADGTTASLDFREKAPGAAHRDM